MLMEKFNNLSIVSENREPQRAYYIPFSDMEDAIRKYIELLDIPNKSEVTEYMLKLYEKAQG
jgi:hypothetical protein